MMRKLNQADLWLMSEIKNQLLTEYGVKEEHLEGYIDNSNFMKFLYENPVFTHHEGPEKWAKHIAENNPI
ncbi:hypothetical protein CON36_34590 [Bacillus cereus]|uniref:Uncharacterized protein n=2 Tax=Bacillus cereus group TaxID=86661 RepID=A0A9X6ZPY6_BACTU|nr:MULTISPECIES: hypothetical protein [Bacillus cereus group]PDZ94292.1 hypothetical protein CON36_34590 [Bacillus cereus]PFJ27469.1 hypothetical protein COJ15_34310 [Bacillus thuringiensis]